MFGSHRFKLHRHLVDETVKSVRFLSHSGFSLGQVSLFRVYSGFSLGQVSLFRVYSGFSLGQVSLYLGFTQGSV